MGRSSNPSRANLLEKAGKTFSLAQLENKRSRLWTLAIWIGTIVCLVLFIAGYVTLTQHSNPRSDPSSLSSSNDSNDFRKLDRRDRQAQGLPDTANDRLMLAATGQSGALWLGNKLGEIIGDRLAKRDLPVSESTAAVPTHNPDLVSVPGPSTGLEVGLAGEPDVVLAVEPDTEPATEQVTEPATEPAPEKDPHGPLLIAQVETEQGAIMRETVEGWENTGELETEPAIEGESEMEEVFEVYVAGGITMTRKVLRPRPTRTRTSRIPWFTPVTTGLPVSTDFRCGRDRGRRCGAGLCCSEYVWCGVTDGHCGNNCQSGFGRCNSDPVLPVPIATVDPKPSTPTPPAPAPAPAPPTPDRANQGAGVVAYFPNWGPNLNNYNLSEIDVVNYAFTSMGSDGSLPTGDFARGGLQFTLNSVMKSRYPRLRTVFSIGGWTDSRWFSVVAADRTRRERFADHVARYMNENRFDGVDLDWEYPTGGGQPGNTASPQDPQNFVLMIEAIRRRIGYGKLITIAASADTAKYGNQLRNLGEVLDWINLMTYDFSGPWQSHANLNAPLDLQASAMRNFHAAGVPKHKLSVGLAFYGRGFSVASGDNGGRGQRITGAPSAEGTAEPGVWAWSGLRRTILANGWTNPSGGWQRTYHQNIHTPTLFHPSRRIFIGYDDPRSICEKSKWARQEGYGGVMVWELSMDVGREMSDAMVEGFAGRRVNC